MGLVKSVLFFGLTLVGAAQAQEVTLQNVAQSAGDVVTAKISSPDGQGQLASAAVKEGEMVDVAVPGGLFKALIAAYPGYLVIGIATDGRDLGQLFVYERQNANLALLNTQPILGRATSLKVDLNWSIEGLKRVNGLDPAQSLRALVDYFKHNPKNKLTAFADDAQLGRAVTAAKPVIAQAPPPAAPAPVTRPQRPPAPPVREEDDAAPPPAVGAPMQLAPPAASPWGYADQQAYAQPRRHRYYDPNLAPPAEADTPLPGWAQEQIQQNGWRRHRYYAAPPAYGYMQDQQNY